jgi:hypothetical protein
MVNSVVASGAGCDPARSDDIIGPAGVGSARAGIKGATDTARAEINNKLPARRISIGISTLPPSTEPGRYSIYNGADQPAAVHKTVKHECAHTKPWDAAAISEDLARGEAFLSFGT